MSFGSPYVGRGRLRAFLKTLYEKRWRISQSEQKPAKNNDKQAHRHLKGHLFKLGLVNSPEHDRHKQTSEMASTFFVTVRLWPHYE
jgi:hypothetical protein